MKLISLDIETTGLDRDRDQILQLAMVAEDTADQGRVPLMDLPFWEGLVYYQRLEGSSIALHMNAEILEALASCDPEYIWDNSHKPRVELRGRMIQVYCGLQLALADAANWVKEHRASWMPTVVGKNVAGFDLSFLPSSFQHLFHHRVVDVGSVALGACSSWWSEGQIPGLSQLYEAGHEGNVVHDALFDARRVLGALRKLTGNYGAHYRLRKRTKSRDIEREHDGS